MNEHIDRIAYNTKPREKYTTITTAAIKDDTAHRVHSRKTSNTIRNISIMW